MTFRKLGWRGVSVAAVMVAGMVGGTASASSIYQYDWERADGGGGYSDAGGRMDAVTTTYNQFTDTLTWTVTLGNQASRPTEGFTLAISPGPNPKAGGGDLALLYFDATDTSDLKLSAYSYNGQNNSSSFSTGPGINPDGTPNGLNAPIFFGGSEGGDGSWIKSMSVANNGDQRTMSISTSAAYFRDLGNGNPEWMGYEFGTVGTPRIGFWFHTFSGLNTTYNADGTLASWTRTHEGYFDAANRLVQIVPLPTGVWIAAVGLLGVAGARRRMIA